MELCFLIRICHKMRFELYPGISFLVTLSQNSIKGAVINAFPLNFFTQKNTASLHKQKILLSETDTAFCILYDMIIRMSFFLFFRYSIPSPCSGISVHIYYTYSHLLLTQQAFHLYRKAA